MPLTIVEPGVGGTGVTTSTGTGSNVLSNNPTLAGLTDSGNLTFTGTGNRITGDFSNATVANRVAFQTSTANSTTSVFILPSGTGTTGQLAAFNNSDPTNASNINLTVNTTESSIRAGNVGSGTYLPLTMYTNGSERLRIDTSGNVGIGTSSPSGRLHVATTTNTAVNGAADAGYSLFRGTTNSSGGVLSITGNSTGNGINFTVFNAALNGYEPANYDGSIQVFKTSNTERMRIDSSGNVGIGTSSPSSYAQLAIQNSSYGGSIGFVKNTTMSGFFSTMDTQTGTGSANDFGLGNYIAGGALCFLTKTSGGTYAERMRIDSSGSMGINYTNPSAVLGSTAGGLILQDGGRAGTTTQVAFLNSSGAITWGMTAGGSFTQNSLPAFACRAWVNFNGTGTVAINGSGNVSSITDNGTGAYAVNFTTAMPDANYGANISVSGNPGVSDANFCTTDMNGGSRANPTTTVFSFTAYRFQAPAIDVEFARVSIFR